MAKPISIEFVADVAQYLRETKKLEVSTEDIADALVATSNSADDLERKLSRAMKDAERDTEGLERAIKDLPKASDDAARDIDKDMSKVEDSMADAGKESAQEFKQNLGESLASGDITSIIQDTAGGLVSGLSGPLAAAAAVLAGGAALAFGQMQKTAEQAAQLSETFLEKMRSNLTTAKEEMDAAFKQSQFQDWVVENLDMFQDINDELHAAGINADDYAQALFEGGDELEGMKDKLRGIMDIHGRLEGPVGHQKVVYDETGDAAAELLTTISNMEGAHREANDEARVYAETIAGPARRAVQDLVFDIEHIPKSIPFKVTVDKSDLDSFSGGAFATSSGGRVHAVYGSKPGAAG